jgi:hypothetical protein
MFYKDVKSYKVSIEFLCMIVSAMAIISSSSCSGTRHIPTASIAESGEVEIAWNEVPGALSYNIYMSTAPGVNKLNGYRIARAASPITITGLETGTTYYFVLTVVDNSGESQESNEMAYTAAQDETGSIKFLLEVKKNKPESLNNKENKIPAGIAADGENKKSNRGQKSEPSHTQAVKNEPSAKASKTAIERNSLNSETRDMTVAWDSVPNAVSYNIYWREAPGVTKENGNQIKDVKSPYTFTRLNRGATYYFVVTSVSQAGESEESVELSFSVPK